MRGREPYLFLPNPQGRGLLTVALGKYKLPATNTARNWSETPSLPQLVVQKRGWPRF